MKKLKYFFTSAIVLVAVVVSTVVFAEYKEQKGDLRLGNQISNKSVTVTKGSLAEDGDVQVTKTVSKTDVDGKYNVTFEVKGKSVKTETSNKKDVYAVVVLDKSNSMCNSSNCSKDEKWTSAVNGAKTFASTLHKKLPNAKIALVTFADEDVLGIFDKAYNDATVLRNFDNKDFSNVKFGTPNGGTNLHAGLYEANKLLTASNVKKDAIKYVVVISDGEPTLYYDEDGYTQGPGSYMDATTEAKTKEMAKTVQKSAEVFAIGYDYNGTILSEVASGADHVYLSDPTTIVNKFTDIATIIGKADAGTNATLTDNIGAKFVMTDAQGKTYTSEKFDITEKGKVFSFDITIDEDKITEDGWYPTNAGFTLSYTDSQGNEKTITCDENPEVYWEVDKYDYAIEYYYNNVKDADLTETGTLAKGKKFGVTDEKIKANTKYGYKFDKATPDKTSAISSEKENVIKVYYVADESQTKEISYTVNYYKDGILQTSDTEKVTKKIQVLENTGKVETSKINVTNKYVGYKFDKTNPSVIPETFKNGDVIDVYYVLDESQTKEISYTVNYYKDGVLQTSDIEKITKTVQVLETTGKVETSKINVTNKYVGYKFDKTNPSVIPETFKNGDVIDVYYVLDESQTKEISYTVNYYKDGILQTSDTEKVTKKIQVLENTGKVDINKINVTDKYVGYKFDKTNPSVIPDTFKNGDVIDVYYILDESQTKEISYTVNYYKDGVLQTRDIEKVTKTVQVLETTGKVDTSKINVTNKYFGYKFDKTNPSSIPEVFEDGDVIDVYYVTDEDKVKELTYTVEYYIDGVLQTKDTQIVTKTVQVLKSDNLTVNKTEINTKDKYVGYRFKESNPSIIPDEIKTGEVIKVYYILDESQTKEISYTVNYYKDGVLQTSDIEKVTKTVQILETTGKVETSKINVTNKYFGYKFDKTNPSSIPEVFEDGDVIDVYYVTDEDKVKELTYIVEYYIDGVLQTKDTQVVTKTVQVLKSDNLTVNKTEINTKDKYVGYRFKESNPSIIPDEIKTGEVIKVYYILDESQTKEISYTVNYYKDGVLQTSDIEKITKTVQILETTGKVDANRINVTNKYVGYVFDKTNPSSIPEIFEDGDVINVYYVKGKFTYEVRYYYDRVLDESKTDTFDAYYGDVIESYTDKSTTDYVLEMVENLPLIITEKDNVINVYYKTDGKGVIVPDEDPLPPNTSSNASIYIMLTLVNALGASVLLRKKEN